MKYEDFYPYSDTEALICCGDSYQNLSEIRKVYYELMEDGNIHLVLGDVVKNGSHLRLGNYYNGELYYSEGYKFESIQPYMTDMGLLCQTKGKILLDDNVIITHDNPQYPEYVVGRPTYSDGDGCVYYESRGNIKQHKLHMWEVWRYSIETKKREKLLTNAANPYVYKGRLFYSTAVNGAFKTKWCNLDDFSENFFLQKRIDSQRYPDNLHFTVHNMKPAGRLSTRVNELDKHFDRFFKENKSLSFLDMGCSKGYFSYLASKCFKDVVGYDTNNNVIQLCKDIFLNKGVENASFYDCNHAGFLKLWGELEGGRFDKVMLANGPHYPFLEYSGHSYLSDISKIMNKGGELLLCGPTGMECKDMRNGFMAKSLEAIFNKNNFIEEAELYFEQVGDFVPTAVNPNRYWSLWKKK